MARLRLLVCVLAIAAAPLHPVKAQSNERTERDSIILVSATHLVDPNFARSVVLVMFPPDAGPSGVILNRPSPVTLENVWPNPEDRRGRTDTIFVGGPVEPAGLLFLFRMTPPPVRAWHATEDIFFSGDGALLRQLLGDTESIEDQRFFAGYSGWADGQLEWEIERGDWHIVEVDSDIIYDTEPETLWTRLLKRATLLRADNLSDSLMAQR